MPAPLKYESVDGAQPGSAEPKLIDTTPAPILPARVLAPRVALDIELGISISTRRASGAIACAHCTSSLLSVAQVPL